MAEVIYVRLCLTCNKEKLFSEMVRSKGKIISRCLSCQQKMNNKYYSKKKIKKHPWDRDWPYKKLNLSKEKDIQSYLTRVEN